MLMVPRRRLELPRPCGHRYLKPARLPIPPPGHRCGLAACRAGNSAGGRCSPRGPNPSTGKPRTQLSRGRLRGRGLLFIKDEVTRSGSDDPTGATRSVAAVFGGSGFIGRYVVKRLAQRGYVVRVAVRDPEAALFLKPMGAVGQVVPLYATLANEATVQRAVQDADLVVNLVGILAEGRRGRFRPRSRPRAPPRVARFVGGGGRGGTGPYVRDRGGPGEPEPLRREQGPGRTGRARGISQRATILRPSIVFGAEDQFFNRFAALAEVSARHAGHRRATRACSPSIVGDVADAAVAAPAPERCGRSTLRTRRPAGLDLPRNPGLHPRGDATEARAPEYPACIGPIAGGRSSNACRASC